ncbi:MAG: M1 family metallopeptidase [Ignavibacteria bacterium]|jgi:hypothetical protein
MSKKFILFFLIIFLLIQVKNFAQNKNLFVPLNIQNAYQKGTRNYDGTPGENYWQNKAMYKIKVEIEPETRMLSGKETIKYYNNSPEVLNEIYLRLYQDIYKKGNVRDFEFPPEAVHDGTQISYITVNGKRVDNITDFKKVSYSGTNLIIYPDLPVMPNDSVELKIEWKFRIPKERNLRMGTYAEYAFFIGYWYPQVAVFDDLDGWDQIDYKGLTEFYNDFNDYEVEIKMPQEFLVWATGKFLNADEVLQEEYYEKYVEGMEADSVIKIVTKEDYENNNKLTKGEEFNTWKFKAENVLDFTFATSDFYLWDITSVVVDENTGRRVYTDAAYNPESKDFYEVAFIAKESVRLLSTDMPGVPFPYHKITTFNGSGGMESPMMINDGSYPTREETVGITLHEATHTYFPFYMGTNERKYSWMDEGWVDMLGFGMGKKIEPKYDRLRRNVREYVVLAGHERELPPIELSYYPERLSYRIHAYRRPSLAYQYLKDMLGKEKFKETLQEFMRRWNGKHPMPYDFFFTFEDHLNQDLSWYWKPWFFENGYPDLAVKGVRGNKVKIEKIGNVPIPVLLNVIYNDGSEKEYYKTVEVWKHGNKQIEIEIERPEDVTQVLLGSDYIPDSIQENNIYVKTIIN